MQAHQAGQLARAERGYRQILAQAPQHAEANHLLGLLCSQQGQHREAVRYLQQAIAGGIALKLCIIFLVLKFAATIISLSFGFNGGVFGPSLFMGAMIGAFVAGSTAAAAASSTSARARPPRSAA